MSKLLFAGLTALTVFASTDHAHADSDLNHWVKFKTVTGTIGKVDLYYDIQNGHSAYKTADGSMEVRILYDQVTEGASEIVGWKFNCKRKLMSEDYITDFDGPMAGSAPTEGRNDDAAWRLVAGQKFGDNDQELAVYKLACH
jgi:hypothetical protein